MNIEYLASAAFVYLLIFLAVIILAGTVLRFVRGKGCVGCSGCSGCSRAADRCSECPSGRHPISLDGNRDDFGKEK